VAIHRACLLQLPVAGQDLHLVSDRGIKGAGEVLLSELDLVPHLGDDQHGLSGAACPDVDRPAQDVEVRLDEASAVGLLAPVINSGGKVSQLVVGSTADPGYDAEVL